MEFSSSEYWTYTELSRFTWIPQKEGDIWKEHRKDAPDRPFTFKEFRLDNDYIYMYDGSRAKDPGRPMYLRIPIAGGGVQWTYPNPLQWEDVMIVDARL